MVQVVADGPGRPEVRVEKDQHEHQDQRGQRQDEQGAAYLLEPLQVARQEGRPVGRRAGGGDHHEEDRQG
jgi:hypothetical protein